MSKTISYRANLIIGARDEDFGASAYVFNKGKQIHIVLYTAQFTDPQNISYKNCNNLTHTPVFV